MRKVEDSKKNGGGMGIAIDILIGSVIGLLIAIVLLMVFSLLVVSGKLSAGLMSYLVLFACFLGSFFGGGVIIIRQGKRRILIMGMAAGLSMFVLTLIIGAFSPSESLIGGLSLSNLIAMAAGGLLSGTLLGSRSGKKKAKR